MTKFLSRFNLGNVQAIIENSQDLISIIDSKGKFIYESPSFEELLGYKQEEIIGKDAIEFVHPDDIAKTANNMAEVMKAPGITKRLEFRFLHKDGSWRVLEGSGRSILDESGELMIIASSRDITERNRAEEGIVAERNKLESIMDSMVDGITIINMQGRILYINRATVLQHGYTKEEVVGKTPGEIFIDKRDLSKFFEVLERMLSGEPIRSEEFKAIRKDGTRFQTSVNLSVLRDSEGKPYQIVAVHRDITERKQAEMELKKNKEKFRSLVETTSDWVWEVDENGIYTYCSPKIKDLLGYEPKEILGKTLFDLMPSEEAERVGKIFGEILVAQKPIEALVNVNIHKNGRQIVLETSGVPFFDASGNIKGYRGIDRDITDRKRMEANLHKSTKQISAAIEAARIFTFNYDITTGEIEWGGAIEEITGYTPEEFAKVDIEGWAERIHPEDRDEILSILKEAMGKDRATAEYRFKTKKGYITLASISLTEKQDGKPVRLIGVLQDITERKRAVEVALELAAIVESSDDGIIGKSLDGTILSWNKGAERIYGYSSDEILGKAITVLIPPDRPDEVPRMLEQIKRGERIDHFETVRVTKGGRNLHISLTISPIKNAKGNIVGASTIVRDITEQKRVQEAKYDFLLESLTDGVLLIDREWRYLKINEEVAHMVQMPKEKLIGSKMTDLFPGVEETVFGKTYKQVLETGEPSTASDKFTFPDGRKVWYEVQVFPAPEGLLIIVADITERKRAEEALRIYEHNLKERVKELTCLYGISQLAEIPNISINVILQGTLALIPPAFQFPELTCLRIIFDEKEYKTHNFQETPIKQLIKVQIFDRVLQIDIYHLEDKPFLKEEEELMTDIGKRLKDFLERKEIESDRKRAEEALRRSEERFRGVSESDMIGILFWDANGDITDANGAFLEMVGYTKDEILSKTVRWRDMTPLEYKDLDYKALEEVATTGVMIPIEKEYIRKDGSRIPILLGAASLPGPTLSGVAFVVDITERKQAEEQIRRKTAIVEAINKLFQEALACETTQEVGDICLDVAEELTESKFGLIGEINKADRFDTMAYGDLAWKICKMPKSEAVKLSKNMEIRGIWGQAMIRGESQIVNDPASHPNSVGVPKGHPQLQSFMGIPLKDGDSIIGMIGLANKEGDYEVADQEAIESLAVAFVEILRRKKAEERLNVAFKDFKRSNAELQQFAYVASHDLQEPLRMVTSYVQLLAKRYKNKLDSDADEFIAFAVDGATRMKVLINDLLQYSRVETKGQPFELMDMESILSQTLINLQLKIENTGTLVTHDAFPHIMADGSQMAQILQNLIDNAIKFRGDDPPQIHIGVKQQDGEWLFSVKDNGIGIDPQYKDRIFVIFQRLHGREKYPGTGIGLAVCKKIVDRHGGRIWVESELGKGATFYYTIPIKYVDRL